MPTIATYETARGDKLPKVRHHPHDGRASRGRGYETKCDAKEFASSGDVSTTRGDNIGTLWAPDAAEN